MKQSSKKQDRTRYPLPDPIDDGSRICVKLWIPNIAGHREAFIGAVYNLTRWYSWALDDDKRGRAAAAVWQPIFFDMLDNFYDNCGEDTPCFAFPPSAPFIEWFPNNPYTEPDLVTEGYNAPAWYQATPASNLLLGTQTGDIVTDLTRFPPGSLPTIIPASGLPRFRINLVAPGVVTIHLLNIFAGSLAQITIDDDISTLRYIDMNRDQLAAPFETATTTPVEVEVTGEGAHHIDVIVVSQINDQIPFLHHGGGLRKVEVCNGAVEMPYYELRQNPDDPCLVEQRQNPNSEWTEAFRMDNCCGDDTPLGQRYTDDGILEVTTDGENWEERRDLDPRFTSPTLPPMSGSDGDEKRCRAANSVVVMLMELQADQLDKKQNAASLTELGSGVTAFLVAIGVITGGLLSALAVLTTAIAAFVANEDAEAFEDAFTEEVWDDLLCSVYCNMADDASFSEANWQAIKVDVLSDHPGIAGSWLNKTINAMGPVGLTNAARLERTGTRECDACECETGCAAKYEIFDRLAGDYGTIVGTGTNYIDVSPGVTGYLTLQAIDINDCCYVTGQELLSGNGQLSAFELCGNDFSGAFIPNTPIGNCCSFIEAQFTAPSVLRIFFDECP